MLQRAKQAHEQKHPPSQPRLSQSTLGPHQHAQATSQAANPNPGYRNPLKPVSASAVNTTRTIQPQSQGAVKRTASGMAKALNGSFDDDFGTQYQPINIGDQSPAMKKRSQVVETQYFDENEFDDDIDLDIEEPRGAVTYPKLPTQPSRTAQNRGVTYPTLPKLPHAQAKPSTNAHTFSPTPQNEGFPDIVSPDSSAPLPWSSSPAEHFTSRVPQASLQHFALGSRDHGSTQAKPAKRRTLPWLDTGTGENTSEPTPTMTSASSNSKSKVVATPFGKDKSKDKSIYPWNTTASAIKDQQKKHREEAKKSVKKMDGTEESLAKARSTQKRPARVFLSEEQQHILDLVIDKKKSVFFTGSAGTGKSVLMREIIASLRRKFSREPDRVAVTASTGLAACNVGGVTLHSFAGIGLGKESVTELVRKIKRNQKAKHRWMRTKVLVVDEVSMVDGELFDKPEAIARQIRNNARPFGGIQLVITGDFFQLPPVPDNNRVAKFAFDAATWPTSIEHTIGLHHVFRQKDPVFAGMLNEMREGRLSPSSIEAFRKLSRPLNFDDMLTATELFPTRQEVDHANSNRLLNLQGAVETYDARDGGSVTDKAMRDKLLANCMAPEKIILKKGAQVMLIKNIDETLVNGSLGRVIGFMDQRSFDSYNNNEAAFLQSPGGTLQSSDDSGILMESGDRHPLQSVTTSRRYPLVRFAITDGTWRDLLCEPESWKVELPNGEVQASRSQVPLILAWALSIHKAQGQTLERVKVDLGKVFEKGQAYVALSRATSMAGLQVLRFDPRKVNAHERVRSFYSQLARVELAKKDKERMEQIKQPTTTTAGDYERRFVKDDDGFGWE